MAGFGGDARVALLTGLVTGINQRKENERVEERTRILNEQAKQMIAESAARVNNYDAQIEERARQTRVAKQAAAAEVQRQEAEQAAELERFQTIAASVAERTGRDPAEVMAFLQQGIDSQSMGDLLGIEEPDNPSALDSARARDLHADARSQEIANEEAAQRRALMRDPRALQLRRLMLAGDPAAEALVEELDRDFDADVLTEYMDSIQPQENGRPVLTSQQRSAAREFGEMNAVVAVQLNNGNVAKTIADVRAEIAAAPTDDPYEQASLNALLEALQGMLKAEEDAGGVTFKPGG